VAVPAYIKAAIKTKARTYLRDDPKVFTDIFVSQGTPLPIRLPVASVKTVAVTVDGQPQTALVENTDFTVDTANGYVTLDTMPAEGVTIYLSGTYYEWWTDAQLSAYCDIVIDDFTKAEGAARLEEIITDGAVQNALAMATLVEGLWSLLTELALDIDVNSPEIDIPVSTRYRQVYQLLLYWQDKLTERLALLNIGLGKIEMFNLRRVSLTTGRLVPLYVAREFDDTEYPDRVQPPIDPGGPVVSTEDVDVQQGEWFPLTVTYGFKWEFSFTYKVNGVPVDNNGYTAKLVVKADREIATPVTLECSTTNGRITLGGADGTVSISVDAADMEIDVGVYVYDLAIYEPDDTPIMLLNGPFSVEPTTL
jgi:hypothetical protein